MSGHSKWSTIKHKKAKTDSARAAEFQKFSRAIAKNRKIIRKILYIFLKK